MSQSLSRIWVHLIFSTKERFPYLKDPALREEVFAYLSEVCKQLKSPSALTGGHKNHVHIRCCQSKNISTSELVGEVKSKRMTHLLLYEYPDYSVSGFTAKIYYSCPRENLMRIAVTHDPRYKHRSHMTVVCQSGKTGHFEIKRNVYFAPLGNEVVKEVGMTCFNGKGDDIDETCFYIEHSLDGETIRTALNIWDVKDIYFKIPE